MSKNNNEIILPTTNLYSEALERLEVLSILKSRKEKELSKAPNGKIHIINYHGQSRFYLRTESSDKSGTYIAKSDSAKLKTYIQKSYDEKILKLINAEISNLETFIDKSAPKYSRISAHESGRFSLPRVSSLSNKEGLSHSAYLSNKEGLSRSANLSNKEGLSRSANLSNKEGLSRSANLSDKEGFLISDHIQLIYSKAPNDVKKYITPIDMSDEDYIAMWLDEEYVRKEIGDSVPVYETNLKERVRSKSELTIANTLSKYGIPYKYECPLTLRNGYVIHPDFTVLNIKKRQQFYWEHRGMMDDPDYATSTVFRMKSYMNSGIILGKNLIITEETASNPLGTNEIEAVIENFLCN